MPVRNIIISKGSRNAPDTVLILPETVPVYAVGRVEISGFYLPYRLNLNIVGKCFLASFGQ